ncbi:MAG TPA: 50S ribosomal protein L22 [Candidatus Acidoferrales bacterium]|nr:50S ribosomal protein L22 [Candidatus Acidoferrales bacterium]
MSATTPATERTEAVAHLRFARMAPRKLRRVADAIRGKSVKEALVLLRFAGVFAAAPIEKLLRSAAANAENNHNMSGDDLYVRRIMVDGGPGGRFTKRIDPRAQGRAAFKRKRMSHVTIVVGERPAQSARRKGGAAVVSATQKPRRATAAAASAGSKKKSAPKKRAASRKKANA